MKILRYILTLVLTVAAVATGYFLFKTIQDPILFEQDRTERDEAVIEKLKTIRSAQLAYKQLYGHYAGAFDTLQTVIKTENFEIVKQIGDPNDSTVVSRREVIEVPIIDSLFKGDTKAVDEIALIPNGNGEKFKIQADIVIKNEIEIPAFQVEAPYEVFYDGLNKQFYADKVGSTMRVGSVTEGNTTGNWEKGK